MRSFFAIALIALAISVSFAAKVSRPCPKPESAVKNLSDLAGDWIMYKRSDETAPESYYNDLAIKLDNGKFVMTETGDTHGKPNQIMDEIVGEYDANTITFKTKDGKPGQIWAPYYSEGATLLASCVSLSDNTSEVKTYIVSRSSLVGSTKEMEAYSKSLTGKKILGVCRGSFC